MKKKGVILVLVLGVILVVVIISMVVISVMLSQTRLTKHQIDRTKAKYAAQAGVNYALEMLRLGTWQAPSNHILCRVSAAGCDHVDADLPYNIIINISAGTACGGFACVNATVNYTYVDR